MTPLLILHFQIASEITEVTISSFSILQFCGAQRPFDINITDNAGMEVAITKIANNRNNMIIDILQFKNIICRWFYHFPITALMKSKVIHLTRPFRCQTCCFGCCLQELEVIIVINNVDVIFMIIFAILPHWLPLSFLMPPLWQYVTIVTISLAFRLLSSLESVVIIIIALIVISNVNVISVVGVIILVIKERD